VSFHCDACTDVVKKPKLDHHYGQCGSSFTCIDCSKTFHGPAQWKGHTSCVTEAEKYQKSLYAGPKKGSRPANGHQRNFAPRTTNAPGKYPQSLGTHSGWSSRQYTLNRASGANSTPLGSPRRMSPADPLAVESSLSSANAASVTEHGEGKKRDSGAVAASHTPNGGEPKEKQRKRKHDHTPREHSGQDVAADEPPAKVDEPSEKRRGFETDGDGSLSKTQPPTEDNTQKPGDKKVKKRKKGKRDETQSKQENINEEHIAPPEPVAPHSDDNSKDEKKAKKRKRNEKREEDAQAKEGDIEPEPLASQTDGTKRKKRKDKEKAVVEIVGADQTAEDSTRNDGEKKRKRKRSDVR